MQKFDHNMVFEKNAIFRLKLSKIAENCDHNIAMYVPTLAQKNH
jgi:hypothetical protein